MNLALPTARLLLLCSAALTPLHYLVIPAEGAPPSDLRLNNPQPTTILVRVVSHGAMVLGREVGSARVTITDMATKQILATGIQQGDAGDQNQIMRTPRLMEEPHYSSRPAAAFIATFDLLHPTLVEVTAEGPLAYPASSQRASATVWLVPGQDTTNDGIVLHLYGYIVQIEHPKPGESLIAKDDVILSASIRTLSGALVRPHGDWDSRKVQIYGEVLIGDRVLERLQMFYNNDHATFEAPFFVPLPKNAPDGITLRVVAADPSSGNVGVGKAKYPVLNEQLKPPTR
ncbi:hypothetical protein AYO43_10260 [Nitrospira sp. SCGC AG-212-E16]|nr:hypothetical protein AYO43_10260 [Nitrospira sp. SCGC AG-212-E16]